MKSSSQLSENPPLEPTGGRRGREQIYYLPENAGSGGAVVQRRCAGRLCGTVAWFFGWFLGASLQ